LGAGRTQEAAPAVIAGLATGIPRSVSADGTIGPSPKDGSMMPASSHVCRPLRTPDRRDRTDLEADLRRRLMLIYHPRRHVPDERRAR
jgi:hypothetical protein